MTEEEFRNRDMYEVMKRVVTETKAAIESRAAIGKGEEIAAMTVSERYYNAIIARCAHCAENDKNGRDDLKYDGIRLLVSPMLTTNIYAVFHDKSGRILGVAKDETYGT